MYQPFFLPQPYRSLSLCLAFASILIAGPAYGFQDAKAPAPIVPAPIPLDQPQPLQLDGKKFSEAVTANRLDTVQEQLTAGQNANLRSEQGYSMLQIAAIKGHSRMVSLLLDHGADVNLDKPATPLIYAASMNHAQCAKHLLTSGADPNIQVQGKSALHIAAIKGHVEIANLLDDYFADLNQKDNQQDTALHLALRNQNTDFATTLLNLGADPTLTDSEGKTALDLGRHQKLKPFVEFANRTNENRQTSSKRIKTVKDASELIKALADSKDGDTIQLEANVYRGEFFVVKKKLTIVGAANGHTILQNETGKKQFVLLLQDGAEVKIKNVKIETTGEKQVGIWIDQSTADLSRCEFKKGTHYSVYGKGANIAIRNCLFQESQAIAVYTHANSDLNAIGCRFENIQSVGIQIESKSRANVKNCEFFKFKTNGIVALSGSRSTILESKFHNGQQGIVADRATTAAVVRCEFENCNISVNAQNISQDVKILRNQVGKIPAEGRAFHFNSNASTLVANNRASGGKMGITVSGQFKAPVGIVGNWITGCNQGCISIAATNSQKNQTIARILSNKLISQNGYGIVIDGASPTTLHGNLVASKKNMAVSIQRNSQCHLSNNTLVSPSSAINFYHAEPKKSVSVQNQVLGFCVPTLDDLVADDETMKFHYFWIHHKERDQLEKSINDLFASSLSTKGPAEAVAAHKRFESNLEPIQLSAKNAVRVSFEIRDKLGRKREQPFTVYQSASAAAGLSKFVASDIRNPQRIFERLADANSLIGHRADSIDLPESNPTTEKVLSILNDLIVDPELFSTDRAKDQLPERVVSWLAAMDPKVAEQLQRRNRLLLDRVLRDSVAHSGAVGHSEDGPVFVEPGNYWIVSTQNRNWIQETQLRSGDTEPVVFENSSAIWFQIAKPENKTVWKLIQLRSKTQSQRDIGWLRRPSEFISGVRGIEYTRRPDTNPEQVKTALELARQSLPFVMMGINEAEKANSDYANGSYFIDSQILVQRILSVVGSSQDAEFIASKLHEQSNAFELHRWMAVIQQIESWQGKLDSGQLASFTSSNDKRVAVAAATRLHLAGIRKHDQILREFLLDSKDFPLAVEAAFALLDDPAPETRHAMLNFHNQLLLEQTKSEDWQARWTLPSFVYLLAYGNEPGEHLASAIQLTDEHLFYLSVLAADPLSIADELLASRRINLARDLGICLTTRTGGDALYQQLLAKIIEREQDFQPDRMRKLRAQYRSFQESELFASFYRPSQKAASLIGDFDQPTFVQLKAREDMYPTLQGMLSWYRGSGQLATFVKNWQAEHDTYTGKFDYYTIEEIEEEIKKQGNKKIKSFDLLRAAHAISARIGCNNIDPYPRGRDRRAYLLAQPKTDKDYRGAISGVVEMEWEETNGKTLIRVFHRQAGYFHDFGTLATMIDGKSEPAHWPVYQYLDNNGRKLFEKIQIRKNGKAIATKELRTDPSGAFIFEVDETGLWNSDATFHLHINFFEQKSTLSFPMYHGENARNIRGNQN